MQPTNFSATSPSWPQLAYFAVRRAFHRLARRAVQRGSLPLGGGSLLALTLLLAVGCSVTASGGSTDTTGSGSSRGNTNGSALPTITITPPPKHPPLQLPSSTGSGGSGQPAGMTGIKPHLGGVPAFTTDDMATFVKSTPLPLNFGGGGQPTITTNSFLTAGDLGRLLGTPIGRPDDAQVGFVLLQGHFTFPGAGRSGPAPSFPYAFEVFDAQSGNLLQVGALPQAPTPPTATVTPTLVPPVSPTHTPTPIPALPPQLSVSPTGTTNVVCGALPLSYPPVTVRNNGGGTLIWQVSATNSNVTVSPSSGSLGAGQARTLSVSQSSGGAGTDLHFTSNGGSATISFVCIPG